MELNWLEGVKNRASKHRTVPMQSLRPHYQPIGIELESGNAEEEDDLKQEAGNADGKK